MIFARWRHAHHGLLSAIVRDETAPYRVLTEHVEERLDHRARHGFFALGGRELAIGHNQPIDPSRGHLAERDAVTGRPSLGADRDARHGDPLAGVAAFGGGNKLGAYVTLSCHLVHSRLREASSSLALSRS